MLDLLSAVVDRWIAVAPDLVGPAYPFVSAAHILSLALLVGSIAVLDLRLLGAFRTTPAAGLAGPLVRVAGWGLAFALLTGLLLFSVQPGHYLANPAFLLKLALVTIGILNAWVLGRLTRRPRALQGEAFPVAIRVSAGVSLSVWVAAIVAGRWIAFL